MMWRITYTTDFGETEKTVEVSAVTYTQAYVDFMCKYDGIILEIERI